MPTVLILFGLRFYFYSEEHSPIHIHVESGDGKAKINVEDGTLIENKGLKPNDLKKAISTVKTFKNEFIKAWNEHFDEQQN